MNSIKTLLAAVIATASLAGPSVASGIKLSDSIQIDPSLVIAKQVILPMAMRGKGCTFYEHTNGGGESWRKNVAWLARASASQDIYAEYVTYTGDWWNDRISSFKCDFTETAKCTVALSEHRDRGGREVVIMGEKGLTNLTDYALNDQVSSFKIFCNHMK